MVAWARRMRHSGEKRRSKREASGALLPSLVHLSCNPEAHTDRREGCSSGTPLHGATRPPSGPEGPNLHGATPYWQTCLVFICQPSLSPGGPFYQNCGSDAGSMHAVFRLCILWFSSFFFFFFISFYYFPCLCSLPLSVFLHFQM